MADQIPPLAAQPWVILGAGRVGRTLSRLAEKLGVEVRAVWNRTPHAEAGFSAPLASIGEAAVGAVVWVTVADAAINEVSAQLAALPHARAIVLHCSGSRPSTVLRDAGLSADYGSVHPLFAIADPDSAVERLAECHWSVEGTPRATAFGRELLGRIGAPVVEIDPEAKTLYHASAVASAGLVVALLDAAIAIAGAAGIEAETARRMLVSLTRTAVDNLQEHTPAEALTGPAARGDLTTIEAHLRALEALEDPELAEIYRILNARALRLTHEPG